MEVREGLAHARVWHQPMNPPPRPPRRQWKATGEPLEATGDSWKPQRPVPRTDFSMDAESSALTTPPGPLKLRVSGNVKRKVWNAVTRTYEKDKYEKGS